MRFLRVALCLVCLTKSESVFSQFQFESYPAIQYDTIHGWIYYDRLAAEKKFHYTTTIAGVIDDSLTIQITSFWDNRDSSVVRLYRGKKLIQVMNEKGNAYYLRDEPAFIADFNGDKLKDIKINVPGGGNGLASLNLRTIYLFQMKNGLFRKVSYEDKGYPNMIERDLDGDGSYEIITKRLTSHNKHSYWVFDLYSYNGLHFVSANDGHSYPIMVQFLNRDNYEITRDLSRAQMKEYGAGIPQEFLETE